jgi:putative DNA primase/helicase
METIQGAWRESGATTYSHNSNFRISADTVKQAASGRWLEILTAIGIPAETLSGRHTYCPIEGAGRDRFRFDGYKKGTGSWICTHCGSGNGFKLIQLFTGKTWLQALELVASILGTSPNLASTSIPASVVPQIGIHTLEQRKAALNAVWESSLEVSDGDPVWRYLTEHRGLKLDTIPKCLRFHPELDYYDGKSKTKFPSMVALVVSADNHPVCLHRTYLSFDGQKAAVPQNKKLMPPIFEGATKGGAIRLYEAEGTLAIAEGLETALACHAATGLPVWSIISASVMPSVVIPAFVKEVIIFSDHDANGVGQAAAKALAKRLLVENKTVKLLIPPEIDTDWADVVTSEGA